MDIKLTDGDISVTASGDYSFVKALDEVLQRALLCAKIRKGSFIYNKDLGTELYGIDTKSPYALKTANMLLSEELMGMSDCKVTVSSLQSLNDGSVKALIEAESKDGKRKAEVILIADL